MFPVDGSGQRWSRCWVHACHGVTCVRTPSTIRQTVGFEIPPEVPDGDDVVVVESTGEPVPQSVDADGGESLPVDDVWHGLHPIVLIGAGSRWIGIRSHGWVEPVGGVLETPVDGGAEDVGVDVVEESVDGGVSGGTDEGAVVEDGDVVAGGEVVLDGGASVVVVVVWTQGPAVRWTVSQSSAETVTVCAVVASGTVVVNPPVNGWRGPASSCQVPAP